MEKALQTIGQRATKETVSAFLSVSRSRHLKINAVAKEAIANTKQIKNKQHGKKSK